MIDEVTLAIILNTPGSFPAPMAPPLHRVVCWGGGGQPTTSITHHQPVSNPAATTRHHHHRHSFNRAKGGGVGEEVADRFGPVSNTAGRVDGRTAQQIQIQPHQRKAFGRQPPHSVCYRRKTWQQDIFLDEILSQWKHRKLKIIRRAQSL